PRRRDPHEIDPRRNTLVTPTLGIQIDAMACLYQMPAQKGDIRLGASTRRLHALEVQGQMHGFAPRATGFEIWGRRFRGWNLRCGIWNCIPPSRRHRVIARMKRPAEGILRWAQSAFDAPCDYAPGIAWLGAKRSAGATAAGECRHGERRGSRIAGGRSP